MFLCFYVSTARPNAAIVPEVFVPEVFVTEVYNIRIIPIVYAFRDVSLIFKFLLEMAILRCFINLLVFVGNGNSEMFH